VRVADPLKLLSSELSFLRQNITSLLGSKHPALDTIAKYYFRAEGKHVRPMIVLLMSQATNGLSPRWNEVQQREADREQARREGKGMGVDEPLEQEEVLMDENPSMLDRAKDLLRNPIAAFSSSSSSPSPSDPSAASNLLPTQRRLAEITELIHVASLLHDDVIDLAATRRSAPSAPSLFGNKLSILAGDFLLARASLALSRLGSNEVVELVASVLANLVEGEVMQMKGNVPTSSASAASTTKAARSTIVSASSLSGRGPTPEIFEHYMRKTYLKTASLIAKSARATVILGGAGSRQGWVEGEAVKDIAYEYGRNLGIAFQVSLSRWAYLSAVPRSLVGRRPQSISCRARGLTTELIPPAHRRHARLYRLGCRTRQARRRRRLEARPRDRAGAVRVGRVPRAGRVDRAQVRTRRRCGSGTFLLFLHPPRRPSSLSIATPRRLF
jgi:hexaprenyl-diphosphate synthase